jgi:Ran-binding protein 9/10
MTHSTTIGIGFSGRSVALNRPPGWEPESWGYHGDDGHVFGGQNMGKPYGTKFGTGDTIGCLVNFRLGHVLFTKNGNELGTYYAAFRYRHHVGIWYPC